ncbi:hypothetical protein WJX84_004255 [Apatococcus fuscideae]|uniref:Uncharacterized protein n=1 Tax=Apatococcus fuscideae TaxID=2026836 RepID=A0AAW1SU86_9CHLO
MLSCRENGSLGKYEQMLTVCACAIRKAIVEHREDETDAIQTALRIGNVPDELRGFAMKKALTKPLLGFITDRTSFNLDGLDFGNGPPQFNLGLPTWPFNVSTVVSKTPTGFLVQLMLDDKSTPTTGVVALLQALAPAAHFL